MFPPGLSVAAAAANAAAAAANAAANDPSPPGARYVIRKRIKLPPERAIFIFIRNVIPQQASLMSTIYEEEKDEDGFLYITYTGENTFG